MSSLTDLAQMTSLSKSRQLSGWGQFYELEEWWERHRSTVVENWYFYQGLHKLFFSRYEGEGDDDFLRRVKSATIENHVKPIIDILTAHLYGGGDKCKRFVTRNGAPDDKLQKWFEQSVWAYQNQGKLNDGKALNTHVTGYTILQRRLFDFRTGRLFKPLSTPSERAEFGVIDKQLLDSSFTIPFPFIDENGIVHPNKLGAVITIMDVDNFLGSTSVMTMLGRTLVKSQIMEYVDDTKWLRWKKDEDKNEWVQQTMFPGTGYENTNPYGRVDIPFTVYANTGDPFYIEGDSDVNPLKEIQMELNELGSGDKTVIDYHQNPLLAGYGDAALPDGFVRKANSHVSFPRKYSDSRLEYVVWDGKLEASKQRQDMLRMTASFLSGVSLISRGFLKEIGQIRSGPPLKALFSSERAVMSRKFVTFGASEQEDMRADVFFWEKATGQKLGYDKTVKMNVQFEQDFLGIDQLLEQEIKALQVQSGSEPLSEILKREHPDWSDAEIDEAIKSIAKQTQPKQGAISKSSDNAASEQ